MVAFRPAADFEGLCRRRGKDGKIARKQQDQDEIGPAGGALVTSTRLWTSRGSYGRNRDRRR